MTKVVVITKVIDDLKPYPFDSTYEVFKEVMGLETFKMNFPDLIFNEKKVVKIDYSTYAKLYEVQ